VNGEAAKAAPRDRTTAPASTGMVPYKTHNRLYTRHSHPCAGFTLQGSSAFLQVSDTALLA